MSNYLNVTSATGATTPHIAGLVVGTSSLDMRFEVAPIAWANGTFQTLGAQYLSGSGTRYGLWITPTGFLEYDWYDTIGINTAGTTVVIPGVTNGVYKWIRMLHNVTAGTIIFYTSPDGTTWTQIGATNTGLSTNAYSTTGTAPPYRIGSDPTGDNFIGQVRRTQVLVGGATILNMDWGAASLGGGPWTATSGEVWTRISPAVVLVEGPPPPVLTLAQSLAARSQTVGQQLISDLSTGYYDGVFYQNEMENWHLRAFPHAALMATLYKYTTNSDLKAQYLQMIKEIVARALRTNTTTGGVFLDGAATTGPFTGFYGQFPSRQAMGPTVVGGLASIEQTANLAWILVQLGSVLDSATYASWLATCKANCDYLDGAGALTTFWINGNYNCQLVGTYWFTSMACLTSADKAIYQDKYERALQFLVSPHTYQPVSFPSPWGLTIDTAGSQYDWSDYFVHLTETNTRGVDPRPDFDQNYSCIQLDALSRIFIYNRDTRLIRLINGISSNVEAKLNTTTWVVDGAGGSRQTNPHGYTDSWLEVCALLGVRSGSTTNLTTAKTLDRWDVRLSISIFDNSTTGFYAAGTARQLALGIAVIREAANIAQFKIPLT